MAIRPIHRDTSGGLYPDPRYSVVRTGHCRLFRRQFCARRRVAMQPLRIVVAGATGRMGRPLIRAIGERDDMALAGALVSAANVNLGMDAGEICGCKRAE